MPVHTGCKRSFPVFLKGTGGHGNNGNLGLFRHIHTSDDRRCLIAIHVGRLNVHQDQTAIAGELLFLHIHMVYGMVNTGPLKTTLSGNQNPNRREWHVSLLHNHA